MINDRTLKNLELDKLLDVVSEYTSSNTAKEKVISLKPLTNYDELNFLIDKTGEAIKYSSEYSVKPSFSFVDVDSLLISAKKGGVLSLSELLKIAMLLRTSQSVKSSLLSVDDDKLNLLKNDASRIVEDGILLKNIDEWILNDTDIADFASEKLFYTRRKIRQTNENIKAKMQEYVVSNKYQKYLQDAIVTIRGNRYVIPVKIEFKGAIPGLIHDQSASGATIFVEPFPIVELNNELVTLYATEKAEIERILAQLSQNVGNIAMELRENMDIISDIDVIFAKAHYAQHTFSTRPNINKLGVIDLKGGRHPLIDKHAVVPVSVSLGDNYSILLVTGSNTGGKTVTLKLVGLITLMAMCGLYIPCEEGSKIGVFSSIFTDIGDEQSIQQSLSTFSAHVTNVSRILAEIDSDSLALFDELGAGTDPIEGSALAISITQEVLNSGAKAIITTHYSELKAFSFKTDGIQNAHMEFDPTNFAPTYKLNIGMPGASNALMIAKRLGLNKAVIERAKSYVSTEKISFEEVLLEAQAIKLRAEKALSEVDEKNKLVDAKWEEVEEIRKKLQFERKKLTENAEKKAKKIIEDYVDEAEEILAKIKEAKHNNDERSFFEASRLNKKLGELRYKSSKEEVNREYDDTPIRVGDSVVINGIDGVATVIFIKPNGKCLLKLGAMDINSTLKDLRKVKSTKDAKSQRKVNVAKPLNTEKVSVELNVIGQNREECLINLEYFIDKAVVNGLTVVHVIHGVGAGILKKAVWEYLKNSKNVKSYRLGRYGEGDSGVTVVELKK